MSLKNKLCFNCLKANHTTKDRRASQCKKCNGKHHILLHPESARLKQQSNLNFLASNTANQILLATTPINLIDRDDNINEARVRSDFCNQTKFHSKSLAETLR